MSDARRLPGLLASWASLLMACSGGADKPAAAAEPASPMAEAAETAPAAKPTAAPAEPDVEDTRPASERLVGRWRMNVAKVPDTALTEEFRKWKEQGKADQLRIEYNFTQSDFTLDTWGPAGRMHRRFHYEILKEIDDSLVLKRIGDDGKAQEIPAIIKDDTLVIGTGNGEVPLERIK